MKKYGGTILLGALLCVLGTCGMYGYEHPWLADPRNVPVGAFAIPVLLVLALLTVLARRPRGRAFDAGFLGAFVILWLASGGRYTYRWLDPINWVNARVYGFTRDVRQSGERLTAYKLWADSVRRVGLRPMPGAWRLLGASHCLQLYRDSHGGALPPDSAAITAAGALCSEMNQVDRWGFSWRYASTPSTNNSFTLESYPRTELGTDRPRFTVDSLGLMWMADSAGASRLVVTIGDAVDSVRACMLRSEGKVKPAKFDGALMLLNVAMRGSCGVRLEQIGYDNEKPFNAVYDNVAQVGFPLNANEELKAGQYVIVYRPHKRAPSEGFDLEARPRSYKPGTQRSYLQQADGSWHVTDENRAATPGDPTPMACELGRRQSC